MCASLKKGKYNLSVYEIDENLIYFQSINKVKKILAFSILKVSEFFDVLPTLKDLLEERIINYFSIQISISKSIENYIILNFVNSDLNQIFDSFNSIKIKLTDNNFKFLSKKHLEKQFFRIGFTSLNSKIHKLKSTNSIIIENERDFNLIEIYTLNLSELENQKNFIYKFTNLINKFNKQGFLIFNVKFKADLIIISGQFIELKNNIENEFNLEYEINKFFNYDVVELYDLEVNEIHRVLWRLDISEECIMIKEMEEILNSGPKRPKLNITQINLKFDKTLEENGINFHRLNPKMIFIENKIMFLIMKKIDFGLISKAFKEIYPKYNINILITDNSQYSEMIKIKKITELPNVKIFNYESLLKFNFKEFK